MVKLLVLILLSACILQTGSGLKILGLFPHPALSHFRVFQPLLKELASRGHELTIISPFPLKEPISGYKDVSLAKDSVVYVNAVDMNMFKKSWYIHYVSPVFISTLAETVCKTLKSQTMLDFLKREEKFDLILAEVFCNDCYMGFIHKYKIPTIGLSSTMIMPYNNIFFGNPVNPSFVPVPFLPFTDKMNFWQRLENTLVYLFADTVYKYLIEGPSYETAKAYFGNDLPPLSEIQKNISVMLVNSHFSYNLPRPLVPNIIEVGGMFLGKPKKLPQDIEKFITDSKHGVVYFSMGSMLKGSSFSEEKRKTFLKSFSKLKQRVIWKYENETMPDKPDNVMIQKWMPQYDVLCHPNVIGFISHGGLLGTTEAVQCEVPIIIMPQFGDQFTNAKSLEVLGVGVAVDSEQVTEQIFSEALNKILSPKLQARAKQFSTEYKDRPKDPLETAVYWVEYVGRHKGAPYIKAASVDLPLYQYLLLDVAAFIITFIFISLIVTVFVIKCTWRKMCGSANKIKTN